MNISCAIIAGGKAKRYNGLIKAFIEIDGKKIIDKNLELLKPIFQDIIIISNNPSAFNEYQDISIYSDYYQEIGPLAGLHSALKHCMNPSLFLMSSDLPYISVEIINSLINKYSQSDCDILVPKIGNKLEPLFGIYNSNIIEKLEAFIEKRESFAMRDFFDNVNTNFLQLDNNKPNNLAFKNINSPKDL